jgi:ABC-2 type transport system ATP-binding protein
MLEARELTKTYDGFTALDALTLKVDRGDVYCLLGATARARPR